MEYFKHGDLQNFMISPLPERDVGIITRQLLEGLVVMHKLGFTHRDLKPKVSTPSDSSQAQSIFLHPVLIEYAIRYLFTQHLCYLVELDLWP